MQPDEAINTVFPIFREQWGRIRQEMMLEKFYAATGIRDWAQRRELFLTCEQIIAAATKQAHAMTYSKLGREDAFSALQKQHPYLSPENLWSALHLANWVVAKSG